VLFLGTFDYSLDERGRVPLPPAYRDVFRAGAMLVQGSPDQCLRAYTIEDFQKESAQYTEMPTLNRKTRALRRQWFSGVHPVQLDQQSRILIPPPLREYAGLQNKVIIAGVGDWLEIWSPETFREEMQRIEEGLDSIQESVQEWHR
jgi:MraZ protein